MKRLLLLVTVCSIAGLAQAQQIETLSGHRSGPGKLAAYGALQGKLTAIDGKLAVITGGYGGVFLNKKILLGAGGYSLANRIRLNNTDNRELGFWYTGGVFEYVHNTDKLFHWSAGMLVGGGGISERERSYRHDKDRDRVYTSNAVFVAEPFVNAEMNITPYIRVIAGGTYRQVLGAGNVPITDGKLSFPSFHLGIKAGIF
ncbi:hypothetical protein [Chitinophaga alhagiae]|uniref:hypothetical protein n=1 Tax=Chitinophaga alhagiae TaxID=2203219 RepID=UPI000E5C2CAC|nr:hypothetical protein [Chitinophaga alhagiae]